MLRSRAGLTLLILVIGSSLGAAATTKPAGVSVTQKPAKVTTRTFNPKNPPTDMPPLRGNEAAVTQSKFACAVAIGVQVSQQGDNKPTMTITDIKAELSLEIVIWLPTDATAKIRAHEDAHRQIAELFYKEAEAIATKIAARYIGKKLDITSIDENHTRPIIQRIGNEFCGEYLGATEVPSEKVQKRFDELTDHGRNRLSEKEAIRRAMAGK